MGYLSLKRVQGSVKGIYRMSRVTKGYTGHLGSCRVLSESNPQVMT